MLIVEFQMILIAERAHAVLSQEGGPQVLGLGERDRDPGVVSPMLTRALNKVRCR